MFRNCTVRNGQSGDALAQPSRAPWTPPSSGTSSLALPEPAGRHVAVDRLVLPVTHQEGLVPDARARVRPTRFQYFCSAGLCGSAGSAAQRSRCSKLRQYWMLTRPMFCTPSMPCSGCFSRLGEHVRHPADAADVAEPADRVSPVEPGPDDEDHEVALDVRRPASLPAPRSWRIVTPRRGSRLGQAAQVRGYVDGVLLQQRQRHDREHGLVRGRQHDRRGDTGLVGARPVQGGDAPAVAGGEAGEAELRASGWTGRCRCCAGARGTRR